MHASTVAFCLLMFPTAPTIVPEVDPREHVETAIIEGIRLLEAEEYEAFVKMFMAPDDVERYTAEETLGEFADTFGQQRAPHVLRAFREIRHLTPQRDADGKKVTYKLKVPIDGQESISFLKIGKYWYVQD